MRFIDVIILCMLLCSQAFAQNTVLSTQDIEQIFRKNVSAQMFFSHVPRGLIVSMEDGLFFKQNCEKLKLKSLPILNEIGHVINQLDYCIVIEGHLGNNTLQNSFGKNNWEISLMRANNITKYLMRCVKVHPEKIFSVGFGESTPFSSLSKNNSNLNDRIDFVILDYETKR